MVNNQYKPGERVFYRENGGLWIAEVLEDRCSPEAESYTLIEVAQIGRSVFGVPLAPERVFQYYREKGFSGMGLGETGILGSIKDPEVSKKISVEIPKTGLRMIFQ